MSINPEFTRTFSDQVTQARFEIVASMAQHGFRVDLIQIETFRLDGDLVVFVSYAGCIYGNIIYSPQSGKWFYTSFLRVTKKCPPVDTLDSALRLLVADLLSRAQKCRLPLLQVSNL